MNPNDMKPETAAIYNAMTDEQKAVADKSMEILWPAYTAFTAAFTTTIVAVCLEKGDDGDYRLDYDKALILASQRVPAFCHEVLLPSIQRNIERARNDPEFRVVLEGVLKKAQEVTK